MATQTTKTSYWQQRQQEGNVNGNPNPGIELRFTEEQIEYLEKQFGKTKNPHPSEMMLIAAETGLRDEEVKAWFAHRMALWRQDQGLNPVSTRLS